MSTIHDAARAGDVAAIQRCIEEEGVEVVNKVQWSGVSPIHLAVEGRHQDAVLYLLEQGAVVEITSGSMTPTIFDIIDWDNEAVWKATLATKPDLALKNEDGEGVLFVLLTKNKLSWFKDVLESGIETYLTNGNALGETPLHVCATNNLIEEAEMLLSRGAETWKHTYHTGDSILHYALKAGNEDFAEMIIEKDPELSRSPNDDAVFPINLVEGPLKAKMSQIIDELYAKDMEEVIKGMTEKFQETNGIGVLALEKAGRRYIGVMENGQVKIQTEILASPQRMDVNSYVSLVGRDGN